MTAPRQYSVELPNTRRPGQTGHYRSALKPDALLETHTPGVRTLYESFQNALKSHGHRNCIGHRPFNKNTREYGNYVWQTYEQVEERLTNFGSGMLYLNETVVRNPKTEQWAVGIFSNNRSEWFITDQANAAYNLRTVALYDTLGPDTVEYIINHSEIPIVVTAANRIPGILQLLSKDPGKSKIPGLKVIISMDELEANNSTPGGVITTGSVLRAWAKEKGVTLLEFTEVESLGQKHPYRHNPPKPTDIATICYTSGTTDIPKGAILTHANFIGAMAGSLSLWDCDPDDVLISYLPLAHIFGRLTDLCVTSRGGSIGYYRGDVLTLIEDMAILKPTLFPSVPRLLTRVYAKLQQNTVEAPGIKGALARRAVAAKLQRLENGQGFSHPLWDRIIFNNVKAVLGGRVRFVLTGSAPIPAEVLQFLRIAFACHIAEGYGQTEGVAAATVSTEGENKAGHVGGPSPCCELKLVDVPDMNYLATDKPYPRGELCYRGTNMFTGYLKDDEKTKETIDEEGWVHTGDVAYINERGAFAIVDRKKNIFKLSQGEYISPEKIENVYLNSPFVLQIFVHGDSLRNNLVAIVVPDPEKFVPWANELTGKNISLGDEEGLQLLVNDPQVETAFLAELDKAGKHGELRGFEFVKAIQLTHIPFSIENDLLTPTLKLKRHQAQKYFRAEIDKLYEKSDKLSKQERAKL